MTIAADHPMVTSLCPGEDARYGATVIELAEAAEAGMEAARQVPLVGDDATAITTFRAAAATVAEGARVALNFCSTVGPVVRWRERNVRELEALARTRLGAVPSGIARDYQPL